ncbi:MAG: adenylyl-sulfate reductase, partial [Rhodobacteraceae bacterium]|nr:adenylyl-sulfate reductase [Paracoccaceae bacterium]
KPAAAYQKNLAVANGGRRNLPPPSNSPAIYGKAQRHTHNY